jgi:hypothetical protein
MVLATHRRMSAGRQNSKAMRATSALHSFLWVATCPINLANVSLSPPARLWFSTCISAKGGHSFGLAAAWHQYCPGKKQIVSSAPRPLRW